MQQIIGSLIKALYSPWQTWCKCWVAQAAPPQSLPACSGSSVCTQAGTLPPSWGSATAGETTLLLFELWHWDFCPVFFKTHPDCTATVVCHRNITVTREAPHEIQEAGSDTTFWGEVLRAWLILLKLYLCPPKLGSDCYLLEDLTALECCGLYRNKQ